MLVIGISGGTGSGKTTIVNKIKQELSNKDICVISQDSYYKNTDALSAKKRKEINFDHPDAIDFNLLIAHIQQLKLGKKIELPIYSFIKHNRTKDTITTSANKVIIVEGILIFNNSKLRDLFDIKFYVDTDTDERLIRRIKRDTKERGRNIDDILDRYLSTLKPMHKKFIAPSKEYADIVIPNNKRNDTAINIIKTIINEQCC